MGLKIDDKKISGRLDEIRSAVKADKAHFVPRPHTGRIDIKLDGNKVESILNHPSGLLISRNRPVFVYIRDHSTMSWLLDPKGLKKIHFTVCKTLRQMKKQGRWERYRVTNRDDDKYYIDLRGGETEARLLPCQNCLNEIGYQRFSYDMPWWQKKQIIESFSAKEALDLLWQCFELFKEQVSTLGPATWVSGYSPLHTQISRAYRAHKGFVCEKCGVNLGHAQQCLDTHHISGVKNNNRYENLLCLCKLCHAEEHPHYRAHAERYRRIIEKARGEQGITT